MSMIPINEVNAAFIGSQLMLEIANLLESLNHKIEKSFHFIDATATIMSLSKHPSLFEAPFRTWLSATNINLFQTAELSGQTKE